MFETRIATLGDFREQVRWADTIYLRGGSTRKLVEMLRSGEVVGWESELAGKTLAGSSAGADAIARYYYGLDDRGVGEGLGLLPVKDDSALAL